MLASWHPIAGRLVRKIFHKNSERLYIEAMAIRRLRTLAAWLVAAAAMLVLSYCWEWPKYRFQETAEASVRQLPGARIIDEQKEGDFASPMSWFKPTVTAVTFAIPDPMERDRFFRTTFFYDRTLEPLVELVDVDCDQRAAVRYDLDEPTSALPARSVWGEPVVAQNGQTYRRVSPKFEQTYPEPPRFIAAFCDTDWTRERQAAGNAKFNR
jgi:hypothetical protein